MNKLIGLQNVTKTYPRGREEVNALRGVSLGIESGEFVAITGPSGSGKTTLLQLIGCMDHPSSGSVIVNSQDVSHLPDSALTNFRAKTIGFVFQQFFLVPTLTALENVELPGMFVRDNADDGRKSRARELLKEVGLGHRMDNNTGFIRQFNLRCKEECQRDLQREREQG